MFKYFSKAAVYVYDLIVHGSSQSLKEYKYPWENKNPSHNAHMKKQHLTGTKRLMKTLNDWLTFNS